MSNDTAPRMTGIDFHDVTAHHVTSEVRVFPSFAVVNIRIARQDITLFTTNAEEAFAILRHIGNYTLNNASGVEVYEDIYEGEEPF